MLSECSLQSYLPCIDQYPGSSTAAGSTARHVSCSFSLQEIPYSCSRKHYTTRNFLACSDKHFNFHCGQPCFSFPPFTQGDRYAMHVKNCVPVSYCTSNLKPSNVFCCSYKTFSHEASWYAWNIMSHLSTIYSTTITQLAVLCAISLLHGKTWISQTLFIFAPTNICHPLISAQ